MLSSISIISSYHSSNYKWIGENDNSCSFKINNITQDLFGKWILSKKSRVANYKCTGNCQSKIDRMSIEIKKPNRPINNLYTIKGIPLFMNVSKVDGEIVNCLLVDYDSETTKNFQFGKSHDNSCSVTSNTFGIQDIITVYRDSNRKLHTVTDTFRIIQ